MVLIRGGGERLETFWVKRSDQVAFMPGFRAFVGGTVDPQDQELEVEGLAPGPGRTLQACALR